MWSWIPSGANLNNKPKLAGLEDEEDQRKFLKLHTAYEQKLYRIALKILRSHELAEDAVQ